jgi:hypothetical protein
MPPVASVSVERRTENLPLFNGKKHVSVGKIAPLTRHRASTECGSQTGHRGGVSNAGLVVE